MRWLLILITIGGFLGVLFFAYWTFVDFAQLQKAYSQFARLTPQSSVQQILLAEARQNIHRINVFADGTWTLMSAIIGAIGAHGLTK